MKSAKSRKQVDEEKLKFAHSLKSLVVAKMPPQTGSVDEDLNRILREKFTSEFRTGYVTVNGVCLPEYYLEFADSIDNLEVRDDDVWVCSFPKTGKSRHRFFKRKPGLWVRLV